MPADAARARDHALAVLDWSGVAEALAARCATAAGARDARALRPELSRPEVELWLDRTTEARELLREEAIPVAGVRDLVEPLAAAERGGVLEPEVLADIARSLEAMRRLRSWLLERAGDAPSLSLIGESLLDAPQLIASIDRAIDSRGALRDDASPELVRLMRYKAAVASSIEDRLQSLRRDPDVSSALTDDFFTVREDRYVLPVRSDRRGQVEGILHGRSGSGQSLFVEPTAIVELNNGLRSAGMDIEEEVQRILRDLSAAVAKEAGRLRGALRAHRLLDLSTARARLALALDATRPEIGEGAELELPSLAHPELLLRGAEGSRAEGVVRNDVRILSPATGLVISGPNTGGKTVLLKAVGLACLMLKAGLPVAAGPGARLPLLDEVFADIGDEQSIALSLSTFSGHVANLIDLLEGVDRNGPGRSLVLLDELMAGTDPAEGAALARALLERLVARRSLVIATTHYGDLKTLAADDERYLNAGMEFDHLTLRPSYRMRAGVPGASAALAVAERLGFPPALIERARELVGRESRDTERLIRDLEEARLAAEQQLAQASSERAAAELLRERAEERLEKLKDRDERHVRQERQSFDEELRHLREAAARTTKELQQAPSLKAAQEAIARLDEIRSSGRAAARLAAPTPGEDAASDGQPPLALLRPGARVRSVSLDRSGLVIGEPDTRSRVRVAFGSFSIQLPAEDLSLVGAGEGGSKRHRPPADVPSESLESSSSGPPFTPQNERNTLDLRGRRVEEARLALPEFLQRASTAGVSCVVIIHGHGTGALKQALREELPDEPRILAFRPGGQGEGGDGVTIASLR